MRTYHENMNLLKIHYPDIYRRVEKISLDNSNYKIIESKTGKETLKIKRFIYGEEKEFFIHSKFDPIKEADRFAQGKYDSKYNKHMIYGVGLGYHIVKFVQQMKLKDKLYVIENDLKIFKLALKVIDMRDVIKNSNIVLIINHCVSSLCEELGNYMNDELNFIIHTPSLKVLEDERFRFMLENWNLKKSITKEWELKIENNVKANMKFKDKNVSCLFNKFNNMPIIIVSCGPSLNKNIHMLKKCKNRALIICVGTALKPLLKNNIRPDIFVIIDPDKITYEQIKGLENCHIPLIYLSSASNYTISKYNGPRLIAYGSEVKENDESKINQGGSVATTSLDIAIKMGGNPIVMIGQDLAFTNGKHHADGSMYVDNNQKNLKNHRKVVGINGDIYNTSIGLLSFKYWIERRIEKESRWFINATEEGTFINGMSHMNIIDVISKYLNKDYDFEKIIQKNLI